MLWQLANAAKSEIDSVNVQLIALNITVLRLEQLAKQLEPKDVTLDGMVMVVRLLQFLKRQTGIV